MIETTARALVCLGAFAAFGFAALGSAIGCGLAAASAIGSWKRCYAQGKAAPFQLTILTGVPMSQTFYGMVLMNNIVKSQDDALVGIQDNIMQVLATTKKTQPEQYGGGDYRK